MLRWVAGVDVNLNLNATVVDVVGPQPNIAVFTTEQ